MNGISKSSVSKLCKDIDERVNGLLTRPLAGEWAYLWLDATYLKVRAAGRIVSVAAIIAVAVSTDGRREIVGLHISWSEAEVLWSDFLKSLKARGLAGMKLVISDAHEGLKAAIARVLGATGDVPRALEPQCARLPAEGPAHHGRRRAAPSVPADEPCGGTDGALLHVADMMRSRCFVIDSEADVLAYMTFPSQHRPSCIPPIHWNVLNKEVKRRADVLVIFPNEGSIVRLVGAVLLEANDDWQLQHRYMQIEDMAELNTGPGDDHLLEATPRAA